MKKIDSIYGDYLIDGILEELIFSNPVQRLKGVTKEEQVILLMKSGM